MLVVSVDPVAETAVMISVPRDTGYVPLPDTTLFADGLFPEKVNELATQAALDPATWCPDLADDESEECGLRTVERSIGLYLGIEIHHYALVDMAGFASMIDAIGGVELCLEGRLVDPAFDGSLTNEETNVGWSSSRAAASTTASPRWRMPGAARATSRCRTGSGCSSPTSTAPRASSGSCSRCARS